MFIHPDYNSVTFDFDVAVVRTVERMGGKSIAPIKLVNANGIVPANSLMTVTGWGRTEAGTLPINLKGVIVPVVNNEVCLKQWGGEITYNMMCAGQAGGFQNSKFNLKSKKKLTNLNFSSVSRSRCMQW
jgi:trypsin